MTQTLLMLYSEEQRKRYPVKHSFALSEPEINHLYDSDYEQQWLKDGQGLMAHKYISSYRSLSC